MRRNEMQERCGPPARPQLLCGCLLRRLSETVLAPGSPLTRASISEEVPDAVDGGFGQDDLDEEAGATDD
jgi:hypothetical protein